MQVHGIRLHRNTFVYCNEDADTEDKHARLRNFLFCKDFVERNILNNQDKAETYRLGYETSEDALSWNVFVPLLSNGLLSETMQWLMQNRKTIDQEPELYMWGSKIDQVNNSFEPYKPLLDARKVFEKEIKRFSTEPDIMLIVPNKMVMCIEAKFTSGNPLSQEGHDESGEKPKSKSGLIERYIENWKNSQEYIDLTRIHAVEKLHSQLLRNIVFASWVAEHVDTDWHVVNLVSSTQWNKRKGKKEKEYDFSDPTSFVRGYLNKGYQDHFTFHTWEILYKELVRGNGKLDELSNYFIQKTAHLERAFNFNENI